MAARTGFSLSVDLLFVAWAVFAIPLVVEVRSNAEFCVTLAALMTVALLIRWGRRQLPAKPQRLTTIQRVLPLGANLVLACAAWFWAGHHFASAPLVHQALLTWVMMTAVVISGCRLGHQMVRRPRGRVRAKDLLPALFSLAFALSFAAGGTWTNPSTAAAVVVGVSAFLALTFTRAAIQDLRRPIHPHRVS